MQHSYGSGTDTAWVILHMLTPVSSWHPACSAAGSMVLDCYDYASVHIVQVSQCKSDLQHDQHMEHVLLVNLNRFKTITVAGPATESGVQTGAKEVCKAAIRACDDAALLAHMADCSCRCQAMAFRSAGSHAAGTRLCCMAQIPPGGCCR